MGHLSTNELILLALAVVGVLPFFGFQFDLRTRALGVFEKAGLRQLRKISGQLHVAQLARTEPGRRADCQFQALWSLIQGSTMFVLGEVFLGLALIMRVLLPTESLTHDQGKLAFGLVTLFGVLATVFSMERVESGRTMKGLLEGRPALLKRVRKRVDKLSRRRNENAELVVNCRTLIADLERHKADGD